MVAGTTRSDAQVYFSIGFGSGYYGYYPYGYDYPGTGITLDLIMDPITGRTDRYGRYRYYRNHHRHPYYYWR